MALPSEHGGWGLTFEPVLLGLIVAPTVSGVAIGLAAMLAFLARTPVKVVLVDRWRHRHLDRTRTALWIAAGELACLVALVVVAALTADGRFWIPLVAALPLLGLELWFDMRSRGRRLVPELAGSIGIGATAASIILAGGGDATVAAGAWLVIGARAVASLPFVLVQLRRVKGQPPRRWTADVAQVGAIVLIGLGLALGWVPWVAALAIVVLAAVQAVLARTAPRRAVIVGVQQLTFGLTVAVVAGVALALAA